MLILDEPTAHLDPETAQALMGDVFEAAGERTVLLITHRPEGLEHVDEVVTLTSYEGGPGSCASCTTEKTSSTAPNASNP